ncbi:MAG: DUF4432 family protein [Acidobacteriota bacterium]
MRYNRYQHERNWGARITEYTYRGYAMVALENRFLRVAIAAGKGTDIVEFLYKPQDVDFMWRNYTGLPAFQNYTPTIPCPSGAFIDYYPGGWQELFPNAGMNCIHKGSPQGAHGEVCLLPWRYRIERDDPEQIEVAFHVRTYRTQFLVEKRYSLDAESPVLRIDERIVNESGEAMEYMWGQHPSFGWPFLDESCRLFLPPCRVRTPDDYAAPTSRLEKGLDSKWPRVKGRNGDGIDLSRIAAPETHSHDMAYMHELSDGWFALVNPEKRLGFALRWDKDLFPSLWFWQLYRGGFGFPWFGSTYTIAVEPVTSYPPTLTESIKAGTHRVLGPGGEVRTTLLAIALAEREQVNGIDENGTVR